MEKRHLLIGILIIYIALIFIGAIITVPGNIEIVNGNDKVIHFFEFFVLAIILFKTLQLYKFKHMYILGIILGIAFMIASELVQGFVPSRSISIYDFIADTSGFILGLGVFRWIFYKQ
jgi:VanZ family protein